MLAKHSDPRDDGCSHGDQYVGALAESSVGVSNVSTADARNHDERL
jgi:hypothetical protein